MCRKQLANQTDLLTSFVISNEQVIIASDLSVSVDPGLDQAKQYKNEKEEAVS